MRPKRMLSILALAGTLFMPLAVESADKGAKKGGESQEWRKKTEGHKPVDKDGDGVISRDEWPGDDESFKSLDVDKNGILDDRDRKLPARKPLNRSQPPGR